MSKYLFVYHGGGMPESEEEQARIMQAWQDWMGANGSAIVDGGAPVRASQTVSTAGIAADGGSNPASGYGIFEAANDDAAAQMAKGCPILETGGTVEVAPIMEM